MPDQSTNSNTYLRSLHGHQLLFLPNSLYLGKRYLGALPIVGTSTFGFADHQGARHVVSKAAILRLGQQLQKAKAVAILPGWAELTYSTWIKQIHDLGQQAKDAPWWADLFPVRQPFEAQL